MAVVTVSRHYGSSGRPMAARVCELLGYRYLDKQLIVKMALESGLTEHDMIEFREESPKARSFIERLLMPGPPAAAEIALRARANNAQDLKTLEVLDSEKCSALVRSVIYAEYKKDNAVIVGRGGQAVLHGLPGVLHVLVHASMPVRILRIQAMDGLEMEQAHYSALDHDKVTMRYLDRVFGVQWADPMLYDVQINTSGMSVEQAAQIVARAAQVLAPHPDLPDSPPGPGH